jgi:hypothetical protein
VVMRLAMGGERVSPTGDFPAAAGVFALLAAGGEGSPIHGGLLLDLAVRAVLGWLSARAMRLWDLREAACASQARSPAVHPLLGFVLRVAQTRASSLQPASPPWAVCRSR